jgi:hypothetical protein
MVIERSGITFATHPSKWIGDAFRAALMHTDCPNASAPAGFGPIGRTGSDLDEFLVA